MELYYKDVSPPSRAVYATLKHLGLPVTLKEIEIQDTHSEQFRKINPAHQIPVLIDNGFLMTESRAIMTYLVNKYSPNNSLYPTDPETRAKIDRILYFDGTNLFIAMKGTFVPRFREKRVPTDAEMQAGRNAIAELITMKGSNKFMAGDEVSLADISVAMMFSLITIFLPEEAGKLEVWYKDVETAVPAVKEINDSLDWAPLRKALNI